MRVRCHIHRLTLPLLPTLTMAATPAAGAGTDNGVQVNIDNGTGRNIVGDAANEPTLAVSPIDPDVMVIGWREFPTIESDSRFAGFAWSTDGGLTWTNGGQLDPPPGFPKDSEQSDPVLAVNADGVFYYWSEVFRPGPTSHHVYRSFDGGRTWATPVQVQDPATAGDKEWMAIDATGGMGDGHIYGGWNNFDLGGHCFVRSTDRGDTWSEPVRIADDGGTQWMIQYAVGPDGEVYAAWRNYSRNRIFITKSVNADDPDVTPTFDAFGEGGQNGLDLVIDDSNDPGFIPLNPSGFHQIYLDVDHSGGPNHGHVYCLWADDRNDVCDIYFARSEDGGFTWQTGIRVNNDSFGHYQWMPAMDIAPDGRIDALWYDTRDDGFQSSLYYSFSTDGGRTWAPNRRISDSFDTTVRWPQQRKIGDYIQCISDETGVNLAYAATHNGEQDVWFVRVEPGVAAELVKFDVIDGMLIAGGVEELEQSDDEYVHCEARVTGEAAQTHLLIVQVAAEVPRGGPVSHMRITFEAAISDIEALVRLSLHDWENQERITIGEFTNGLEESVNIVDVPDAGRFVRASDDRIELRARKIVLLPMTLSGFHSFIDHIEIAVR